MREKIRQIYMIIRVFSNYLLSTHDYDCKFILEKKDKRQNFKKLKIQNNFMSCFKKTKISLKSLKIKYNFKPLRQYMKFFFCLLPIKYGGLWIKIFLIIYLLFQILCLVLPISSESFLLL